MINCQECGKKLKNSAKFCNGCGTEVSKPIEESKDKEVVKIIFCPQCGNETSSNEVLCSNCGFKNPVKKPVLIRIFSFLKNIKWKKAIPIVAACLVITVVITITLSAIQLNEKSSKSDDILYLKDNEIYHTLLKQNEPFEVTTNLVYNDDYLDEHEVYNLGRISFLTEDNKILFFPDKIDTDTDNGFSLYFKSLKKTNKEVSKIDSDVRCIFRYT